MRTNPIVRKFYPTPIINFSEVKADLSSKIENFPKPDNKTNYPKVILIDKGIRSNLLSPWVKEKSESLGDAVISEYHADEMASILVGSNFLNEQPYLENDGCNIFDIWIPSSIDSFDDHFDSVSEFMDWLYLEIQSARELGYRVISMSINFQSVASDHEYSFLASRIDEISTKLGVMFIISTGNLEAHKYRSEWPKDENDIFKMLARFPHNDRILQPADSVSALTVGAINHVNNEVIQKGAPTRYTLRGPSTSYGIKPDVVHVGGIGDFTNSYFFTIDGTNQILSTSQGTSLSAPHVAKTVATIDHQTNQQLSIYTLKALILHNASVPKCM
ncbi:S8 family serine peptidase, partial [Vibrio ichthyoenteri]|uniref:S8 family serine peptidase n=1 Tax=Vibrio ichthyoenteri TaxID=142461 RepID=UPI001F49BB7B